MRSFKRESLPLFNPDETKSNKKSIGRPRIITSREERIIERNIKKLRKREGAFVVVGLGLKVDCIMCRCMLSIEFIASWISPL